MEKGGSDKHTPESAAILAEKFIRWGAASLNSKDEGYTLGDLSMANHYREYAGLQPYTEQDLLNAARTQQADSETAMSSNNQA